MKQGHSTVKYLFINKLTMWKFDIFKKEKENLKQIQELPLYTIKT